MRHTGVTSYETRASTDAARLSPMNMTGIRHGYGICRSRCVLIRKATVVYRWRANTHCKARQCPVDWRTGFAPEMQMDVSRLP